MNIGFARGTKVVLSNGTWVDISDVKVGDKLMSPKGLISEVCEVHRSDRSDQVPVFSLDELIFTGGCLFVVQPKLYKVPFLGTHDANNYLKHKRVEGFGFTDIDPYFICGDDSEYLRYSEEVCAAPRLLVDNNYEGPFYQFKLTGPQLFIANGFVVAGLIDQDALEYNILDEGFWDDEI